MLCWPSRSPHSKPLLTTDTRIPVSLLKLPSHRTCMMFTPSSYRCSSGQNSPSLPSWTSIPLVLPRPVDRSGPRFLGTSNTSHHRNFLEFTSFPAFTHGRALFSHPIPPSHRDVRGDQTVTSRDLALLPPSHPLAYLSPSTDQPHLVSQVKSKEEAKTTREEGAKPSQPVSQIVFVSRSV